jgi:hypothetical protein
MRFRHFQWLMWMAALPAGASSIDVSAQSSALLHTGDTLSFEFSTTSYGFWARLFGAPSSPDKLSFQFVSAPVDSDARFAANVESGGAATTVTSGVFHGLAYDGRVSVLTGSLDLDPTLLTGTSAVLTLRNFGPDVVLGLPPYRLPQDLFVTLSGGPLHVGAFVSAAWLDAPDLAVSHVPEPETGPLFLGGFVLCSASALLRRARTHPAK